MASATGSHPQMHDDNGNALLNPPSPLSAAKSSDRRPPEMNEMVKLYQQHVEPYLEKIPFRDQIPTILATFVLMLFCYLVGYYEFSTLWIVGLIVLNVLKAKTWKDKQLRMLAMQETAKKEREIVTKMLESKFSEMPSWVQFPDTERVEWLNKLILQLWPYIGLYAKEFILEKVEPQVQAAMPGPFKGFRFDNIDLGDIPLRVTGVKTYTEYIGKDRIVMDIDVVYAGDADFNFIVAGFKAGTNTIQFKGKLRVVARPLIPKPPLIGAITACFMDNPTMEFNLTGVGDLVELPGLFSTVRSVVETQVANILVMPNSIIVPIVKDLDLTRLYLPKPDGVLRIHLQSARNLENKDAGLLMGKSDPYCKLSVGGQLFRSLTVNNSLNPVWDQWFEAAVGTALGQKFVLEMFDEDDTSKDDYMGCCSVDLARVRDKGQVKEWLTLEDAKRGDVQIGLYWVNLTSDPSQVERSNWDKQWQMANRELSDAVIMIFVDSCQNLPTIRGDFSPSCKLTARYKTLELTSSVKPNTRDPVFNKNFTFLLLDTEQDVVQIEATHSSSSKSLGSITIKPAILLNEPDMVIKQRAFPFWLGAHEATIVLSMRLMLFEPTQAPKI